MKRKFYLDIAVLMVILGGFSVFVFMQQHTPATEAQTQEAAEQSAAGCCGAATVEGETPKSTPGGCCGTSAAETVPSEDVSQQTQSQDVSKTVPQTPQSEDTEVVGGCGCGS